MVLLLLVEECGLNIVPIEQIVAKMEPQELQEVASMPQLPQEWPHRIRTESQRNFFAFKLVYEAFRWMCDAYDIPAEVIPSLWRRFGIAVKDVYLRNIAEEDDVGKVMRQIIDKEMKNSISLFESFAHDDDDDEGADRCPICLAHPTEENEKKTPCNHIVGFCLLLLYVYVFCMSM